MPQCLDPEHPGETAKDPGLRHALERDAVSLWCLTASVPRRVPVRQLKIVVYPHAMEIGGSQLIAVELAARMRERGHEVIVLCDEGPLMARLEALGLERIEIAPERRSP